MTLLGAWCPLVVVSILASLTPTVAQTYSSCNPLTQGGCPPDPALGKSATYDFTNGASDDFTPTGSPSYGSNGAEFTVANSGDSPLITSDWYIMFGKVEFYMKAAPGTGIVSSAVLQSDDLDEIDWEWLGGDNSQVQTNYFGKGRTTTYNRGAFHSDPGNHDSFKRYTVEWTKDQITWSIDGNPVRTLTPDQAEEDQYPQTPMQVKVGAWAGGDPSNAPGTIAWSGGPVNYADGPFTMYVKSITATDYSTGTSYEYTDMSGSWTSIKSNGGEINGNVGGAAPSVAESAPPAITSTSNGPMPFEGTHRDPSSTYTRPSVYPWIPMPSESALQTTTASVTTYPGLPSGWTVNDQGRAVPPSAASATPIPGSSPQSVLSQAYASHIGLETVTGWDDRGFPTTKTVNPAATGAVSYDVHGFPITSAPTASSPTVAVQADHRNATTSAAVVFVNDLNAAVGLTRRGIGAVAAICGIVSVMIL